MKKIKIKVITGDSLSISTYTKACIQAISLFPSAIDKHSTVEPFSPTKFRELAENKEKKNDEIDEKAYRFCIQAILEACHNQDTLLVIQSNRFIDSQGQTNVWASKLKEEVSNNTLDGRRIFIFDAQNGFLHPYNQTDKTWGIFNSIVKNYWYVKKPMRLLIGQKDDMTKIATVSKKTIAAFIHYNCIGFTKLPLHSIDVFITSEEFQIAKTYSDQIRDILDLFKINYSALNYFLIDKMQYYVVLVLKRRLSQCFMNPIENIVFYQDKYRLTIQQGQGDHKSQFKVIMTESNQTRYNFSSIFTTQQLQQWRSLSNCITFGLINNIPLIQFQLSTGTYFNNSLFYSGFTPGDLKFLLQLRYNAAVNGTL